MDRLPTQEDLLRAAHESPLVKQILRSRQTQEEEAVSYMKERLEKLHRDAFLSKQQGYHGMTVDIDLLLALLYLWKQVSQSVKELENTDAQR